MIPCDIRRRRSTLVPRRLGYHAAFIVAASDLNAYWQITTSIAP